MSTYVVTGCAGFIGAKVTELLLNDSHSVIGIDNLNDAYDVRLKHWRLKQIRERRGFEFNPLDILDRAALDRLFESRGRLDGVINLAARAGVRYSTENPWVYVDTNVTGTLNLLELCRKYRVAKFVLASSSSLYGKDNPVPYSEDQPTDCPLSPYAASKKAAEALCYSYHHLYGIDITMLRYFSVYGPAGRPDMSPFRFVQWISEGRPVTLYGDGQQSRDFTYVDDIARGTIAAARPLGCATINLGSDRPVVLNAMIRKIEQQVGRRAIIDRQPAHAADVLATWADITRAGQQLAWEPAIDFDTGLARLVQWYRDNQAWASEISTN
jgi:UDP-glucuronate 4-epimerase